MSSMNMKFALVAVAAAMLATPALAQRPQRQTWNHHKGQLQDYVGSAVMPNDPAIIPNDPSLHYPNGTAPSGTAQSVQSGAEFNLGY